MANAQNALVQRLHGGRAFGTARVHAAPVHSVGGAVRGFAQVTVAVKDEMAALRVAQVCDGDRNKDN